MSNSMCKSYMSVNSYNNKDNIYLIQQFFIPSNAARKNEIIDTLKRNTSIDQLTKIILLNEKIYTKGELGLNDKQMNKIQQVNIGKRLSYRDVFEFVQKSGLKGYIVFTNSDIFLDKTIENISTTPLYAEKTFMAQLRFEFNPTQKFLQQSKLYGDWISYSQDTWAYHTNFQPPVDIVNKIFDIPFGKPGCDNKLIYLMRILGYNIINNPYLIKTYHHHSTQTRNYDVSDTLPSPYMHCFPELPTGFNLNAVKFNPKQELYMKHSGMCERFDMIGENNVLGDYITSKLSTGERFILPRIAGVENNLAYEAAIASMPETPFLEKTLPVMKQNAGVFFNTFESITEYSKRYIDAFAKCDAYFDWEKWGSVYQYIDKSHDFITDRICSGKQPIWAFALDVFNAIHHKPWTHSLKGKRILIVSAFTESIKSKLAVLDKIYGVNLFPECEFVFLKPPQTQGENPSKDWTEEIADFCVELDTLTDKFDVALVSAGGYGNLICAEIFNRGKSAIYVGGVLQMYFGILGGRWEKERPDIVKLYMNEYWSRPSEEEKPKNHVAIEGSCYW
jgi:hypothetical protein